MENVVSVDKSRLAQRGSALQKVCSTSHNGMTSTLRVDSTLECALWWGCVLGWARTKCTIAVREIKMKTTYETPELTELGILNVDTLSNSGGGKKGGGKKALAVRKLDHGGGYEECHPDEDCFIKDID